MEDPVEIPGSDGACDRWALVEFLEARQAAGEPKRWPLTNARFPDDLNPEDLPVDHDRARDIAAFKFKSLLNAPTFSRPSPL